MIGSQTTESSQKISATLNFIVISLPNSSDLLVLENTFSFKKESSDSSWDLSTIRYGMFALAILFVVLFQYYKYSSKKTPVLPKE